MTGQLLTLLAYVVGAAVFLWASSSRKLATEGIFRVATTGFVFGIAGAKLTQLVADGWPIRLPLLTIANPSNGGRALLGGMIFGWVGVEWSKRRLGIKRSTGDMFALALASGEAIGRIGCFFNGCCYGVECRLPWAVYQHGAWRHPTQIYSSLSALGIFLVLLALRSRLAREGDLFLLYLGCFGVTRFGIEFLRWRETIWLGLSPMQWFCLELMVVAAAIALLKNRKSSISMETQ